MQEKHRLTFMLLRISLSFIFLWAFFDKLPLWIDGHSPTSGFLLNATNGPLGPLFKALAGVSAIDWLFMIGLLFVGVSLIINRLLKWGAWAGIAMMSLIYLAVFPPENNPLIDEHIIYILIFLLLI